MSQELNIEIISPTGYLYNGLAYMIVIPAQEGEMGIMSHHESVITSLNAGKITLYDSKEKIIQEFIIGGGFVELLEDRLLVLVD
jgi:F-type H+-transporting ATPase subunit epsilon